MDAIDKQNKEFDALTDLAEQWSKLQKIAIVDDDYPTQRVHYEAALQAFLRAAADNGRVPFGGLSFTALRRTNVLRCEAKFPDGFGHTLGSWSVAEWGNACGGEIGEAQNIAKKMLRFRDGVAGNAAGMSRDDYKIELAMEIADGVVYADLWTASEGIDLGETVRTVFNRKSIQLGSLYRL